MIRNGKKGEDLLIVGRLCMLFKVKKRKETKKNESIKEKQGFYSC